MTEKICKKCGTFNINGHYCEECGIQLYPDIGETIWELESVERAYFCLRPKFDRWTGKAKP